MKYFFDTSSLVKIYHRESGTSEVLNIYNNHDNSIQISELGRVEFISTIHRKFREKEFNSETLDALVCKFQDDADSLYEILQFSSLVTDEAEILIQKFATKYSLKTLDSIQFAFFNVYCESDTIFVCSDAKFCKLVEKKGIQVLVP